MNAKQNDISRAIMEFQYDVMERTQNLLVLLRGVEVAHISTTARNFGKPPEERANSRSLDRPSYLTLFPMVTGFDELDITRRDGRAEQLAYRGWFVEVFGLWESHFRSEYQEAIEANTETDDVIAPEVEVLGDLRHIRNDIVHHRSIATEENAGRCTLLRWFVPGKPITFNITHVLTTLHELNIFTRGLAGRRDYDGSLGTLATWPPFSVEHLRAWQPTPKAVSIRTDLMPHPDTRQLWLRISLVYDNGFFFHHINPCHVSDTEENRRRLNELEKATKIAPEGDISIPALGLIASAQEVYMSSVDGYEKVLQGTQSDDPPLPGFPGPWLRFRR